MRYVLDTTAFSAAMRREPALLAILQKHPPGNFVTVPPVVAEIHYGIARLDSSSKKHLLLKLERDRLLSVITVLPWSPESSENFGSIKADLEQKGKLIDDFDIAIAAIAMAHKCEVVTANLTHFRRVSGLDCKSWQ
jgi:tRNA(fMet)-specific endonuclease VapC